MSDIELAEHMMSQQKVLDILEIGIISLIREIAPHCESPIEVQLGVALSMLLTVNQTPHHICYTKVCVDRDDHKLFPQYEWNNYRFDWAVFRPWDDRPFLVIECDGHEFHERTKEQAIRDRRKDRDIQSQRISILRFTGSEIYHDVMKCAWEIMRFMTNTRKIA